MKDYPAIMSLALLWFSTAFPGATHAAACNADNGCDVERLDLDRGVGTGQQDTASAIRLHLASGDSATTVGTAADEPNAANRGSAIAGDRRWQVKRGETLFSIGRAVFPGDAARQARFRRDVMALNPSVFANGAENMAVGAVLVLPDYAGSGSTAAAANPAAQAAPAMADGVSAGRAARPAEAPGPTELATEMPREPVTDPENEPRSETARRGGDEPAVTAMQSTAAAEQATASASISLGYSRGGDRLQDRGDTGDLYAGEGVHMRLGFEHMFGRGGGYRVAFGLQYNLGRGNGDNATFRDAYLQLAYQCYSRTLAYGIGVVLHTGATQKEATTREYGPAAGALVYLEKIGSGALSGWGLSYTSLEIEAQDAGESIDASRAEIYYSWRF